jgi:hypothetical protein
MYPQYGYAQYKAHKVTYIVLWRKNNSGNDDGRSTWQRLRLLLDDDKVGK